MRRALWRTVDGEEGEPAHEERGHDHAESDARLLVAEEVVVCRVQLQGHLQQRGREAVQATRG